MLHVQNISMPFTANNNNSRVTTPASSDSAENENPTEVSIINATLSQFTAALNELAKNDTRVAAELVDDYGAKLPLTNNVVSRVVGNKFDKNGNLTPSAKEYFVSSFIREGLPTSPTFEDMYKLYLEANGPVGNNLDIKG